MNLVPVSLELLRLGPQSSHILLLSLPEAPLNLRLHQQPFQALLMLLLLQLHQFHLQLLQPLQAFHFLRLP